jgi:hypothetical protein
MNVPMPKPSASLVPLNRTEVERFLPAPSLIVRALEDALRARPFVPYTELLDFYDAVLATLAISPPSAWYPHVVARLHTIACTECPHFQWQHKLHAEQTGWVWRTVTARHTADDTPLTDDPALGDDEEASESA